MRTKKSIKNFITQFITNIITIIFLFIAQTLFIKILGIEYIGLNGLFTNILTILKTNEARYGGVVVLEIPNIYLDEDEVIGEYSDKVYVNSEYQRINPSFIKGYISISFDKCELYTKEEVLNKELDMPNLKREKKNNKNTSQE